MSDITLFMAPGSCARVTCIALEEIGLDFDTSVVRFMKGQHRSPDFLKLNPKGKVPCLLHHGTALTENMAIQLYLNEKYGGLLPDVNSREDKYNQIADLSFCASTLHPLVTRIRMPQMMGNMDTAPIVKGTAFKAMDANFAYIESQLEEREWWYGDTWSTVDAYLYWIFWRVEGADYDVSRFPAFADHAKRIVKRPSVQRALARESEAQALLESEGLVFTPPPIVAAQ